MERGCRVWDSGSQETPSRHLRFGEGVLGA